MLLNNKEEKLIDISNNMNESQKWLCFVKEARQLKGYILYDSISTKFYKMQTNPSWLKVEQRLPGGERWITKGHKEFLQGNENIFLSWLLRRIYIDICQTDKNEHFKCDVYHILRKFNKKISNKTRNKQHTRNQSTLPCDDLNALLNNDSVREKNLCDNCRNWENNSFYRNNNYHWT